MPVTLVCISSELFDDGTIKKWREEHPQAQEHSSIDELLDGDSSEGLFFEDPGHIVRVDRAAASDVRKLHYDLDKDILIITRVKSTAKFDKDGIVYKNISTDDNECISRISEITGVKRQSVEKIYSRTENILATYVLARQVSFCDDNRVDLRNLYNPFVKDPVPWELFSLITYGSVQEALKETERLLRLGVEAQALFFQISGYIRKIIVAKDDVGGVLEGSNKNWFLSSHARIKNLPGLNEDLGFYHDIVINNKRDSVKTVLAFVASLSLRFRG